MRADELIDRLSAVHPKGFDLSLDRIHLLLDRLGNPHHNIPPVIHVAGTNGKGSTIAFCRAILEAAGKRVHVHTSPHLVNWYERFRLGADKGGVLVSDHVLASALQRVVDANSGDPITVFELLSATMFLLFSEHEADFTLLEVGLGGRFDATNVIENPLVSVISPIGLDHQAYLGDTLSEIAEEKGGIIKQNRPVVIGSQEEEAQAVLEKIAESRHASTIIAKQDFDWYLAETGFVYQDENRLLDLPVPRLFGEYQLDNAALAIAALRTAVPDLEESVFSDGMKNVVWPGRFQRLEKGKIAKILGDHPDIWIDGGHNPSAGETIAAELYRMGCDVPNLLVCGMINTKDPHGYFKPYTSLKSTVFTVPVSMSDAGIPPEALATAAATAGLEARSFASIEDALKTAGSQCEKNPETRVFFCGSLYLVGEILALNGTPPT